MSKVKVAIGQQLTSKLTNLTSLLVTTSTVNSIFPESSVYHDNRNHHHHHHQLKFDSIDSNSQYDQPTNFHQHKTDHQVTPPIVDSNYWSINSTTIPTSASTTVTASPLVSLPTSALQIALNVSTLFIQGSSSSHSPPPSPLPPTLPKSIIVTPSSKLIEENVTTVTNSNVINFNKGTPTIKPITFISSPSSSSSSFESNGTNFITNCCNHLDHNLTTTNLPTVISTGFTFGDNEQDDLRINYNNTTSSLSSIGDDTFDGGNGQGGQGVGPSTLSVFNLHESPLNGQLFNLTSVFDQESFNVNWTNNQSTSTFNNITTTSTTLFNDTIINSSYVISSSSSSSGLPLTTSSTLYPPNIITANWTTEPDLRIHHPFLAILLGIICLLVMFGNILIMVAIRRERYLHTVTNLFVASLAVADCLVGAIVMPSSVVHEVMNKWWIFGQDWCDLWHSFDVLASTASILNLCVISLDRYWAITDPISYPARMTNRKAKILIALVWTCSALISFPAILWWRAVSAPPRPLRCDFTEDVGYLLFSSIISFYGPLMIMLVVYLRIYRAAIQQTKSVKSGTKSIAAIDGNENNAVVLRIHRGGGGGGGGGGSVNPSSGPNVSGSCYCEVESHHHHPFNQSSHPHHHHHHPHHRLNNNHHQIKSSRLVGEVSFEETSEYLNSENDNGLSVKVSSVRHRNMKAFSLSRKLAKLAKEKKAAKTLGIVMGVFILCWLPFFIANLVKGFCGDYCLINPDLVYPLVTWLGWLNSGMNPVIYACWSRDFRRAFKKILCSWYKPKSARGTKILQRPVAGGGLIGTGTVQSARYNVKSTGSKKSVKIKSKQANSDDGDTIDDNVNSDYNNSEANSPSEIFNQYNQSVYNLTTTTTTTTNPTPTNHATKSNVNANCNRSPKCPNDSIGMIGLRSTRKEPIVSDIFFLTKKIDKLT